jgi:hypothetical protein
MNLHMFGITTLGPIRITISKPHMRRVMGYENVGIRLLCYKNA